MIAPCPRSAMSRPAIDTAPPEPPASSGRADSSFAESVSKFSSTCAIVAEASAFAGYGSTPAARRASSFFILSARMSASPMPIYLIKLIRSLLCLDLPVSNGVHSLHVRHQLQARIQGRRGGTQNRMGRGGQLSISYFVRGRSYRAFLDTGYPSRRVGNCTPYDRGRSHRRSFQHGA